MGTNTRKALALREAEFDRTEADRALRAMESMLVDIQCALRINWNAEELERCDAWLEGVSALLRQARNRLAVDD